MIWPVLWGKAVVHELVNALARIRHCLHLLTIEEFWMRSLHSRSSIGNARAHIVLYTPSLNDWLRITVGQYCDHRWITRHRRIAYESVIRWLIAEAKANAKAPIDASLSPIAQALFQSPA